MNQALEERLAAYMASDRFAADPGLANRVRRHLPPVAHVRAAGLADRRSRPGRRLAWLAAMAAALLTAAVATASMVQAGGSPIPSGLLHAVGIAPAAGGVPAAGKDGPEHTTAGGHVLTILGTHSDTLRTVIFVGGEPTLEIVMARLYDESGREMHPAAGSAAEVGRDGRIAMQFEPLPLGSHRLTLRIQGIAVAGTMVMGAWELHPTVHVVRAVEVPARPATGTLGPAAVAITAVSGGGEAFLVTLEIRGVDEGRLIKMTEGVRDPGPGAFEFSVTGPHGEQVRRTAEPAPIPKDGPQGNRLDLVETFYWRGAGPGTYRMVLTFEGHRMESAFTLS